MKRILLKISGEALSSDTLAIDPIKTSQVAEMIRDIKATGVELVIVL
jgi:uridylate kinase